MLKKANLSLWQFRSSEYSTRMRRCTPLHNDPCMCSPILLPRDTSNSNRRHSQDPNKLILSCSPKPVNYSMKNEQHKISLSRNFLLEKTLFVLLMRGYIVKKWNLMLIKINCKLYEEQADEKDYSFKKYYKSMFQGQLPQWKILLIDISGLLMKKTCLPAEHKAWIVPDPTLCNISKFGIGRFVHQTTHFMPNWSKHWQVIRSSILVYRYLYSLVVCMFSLPQDKRLLPSGHDKSIL